MPNQLNKAKSPYLKQHENNPVYWYEWGKEALDLAKKENKLVLVSIGYSACHWCHVMAHESFEDEETAKLMNTHFINIKIDREERPDLDAIYMDACQLVTGSGGWPLNAFALPDGSPFHAGTYFPKAQWQKVLLQIAQLWEQDPTKVLDYANDLKAGIEKVSSFLPDKTKTSVPLNEALLPLSDQFDITYGGMNRAPKFPMPTLWNFLVDPLLKQKELQNHAIFTLDQMRLGGIYDWVEGGFARYSVDHKWFAPHFEKMLYDNAQLISLYCKAYAITGNTTFYTIAEECAQFVCQDWKANDYGFFSAYDADSEGMEGKYSCFTDEEINALSLDQEDLFRTFFQVSRKGNWEHHLNILYPLQDELTFAAQNNIANFPKLLNSWKTQLRKARTEKVKPGLDNKQNTAWNAMMLCAFCHLYQVTGKDQWKNEASSLFNYLLTTPMNDKKELQHMVHNGEAYVDAFLEDYAQLTQSFLFYFETFGDLKALEKARQYCAHTITHFRDQESGFFRTAKENKIISQKLEITDNVIPSANSIMCENLLKLGLILGNSEWFKIGEHMLASMKNKSHQHPEYYANWCRLLAIADEGYPYIVTNGSIPNKKRNEVWMNIYSSNKNFAINLFKGKDFSKPNTYYYCANKVCHSPVYSVSDITYT